MGRCKLVVVAALGMWGSAASAQMMIPDSGAGDRIMLFNAFDGSLIDADWLTDQNAQGWAFNTPKEATVVGGELWVADQLEDAIHRFDLDRNFIASIETGAGGRPLDNLRSLGWDGSTVYVVNAGGAIGNAVVKYDASGGEAGFFAVNGSSFDAERFGDDILVSNTSTESVQRYSQGGVFINDFATDLGFAEQVVVRPDGSVIVSDAIDPVDKKGVYHYEADGSLRAFVGVQEIGNPTLRGADLLGNGSYILSASNGIFTATPDGQGGYIYNQVLGGVSGQYVTFIPEPATAALLGVGLLGLLGRRRRR